MKAMNERERKAENGDKAEAEETSLEVIFAVLMLHCNKLQVLYSMEHTCGGQLHY